MVKAYTTKRIGNDGRTYVGANINNYQFEVKVPSKNKILMSKGMGKVLDSKVVKKVAIPVGNATIKAAKWAFPIKKAIKTERDNAKKKDDYYRDNAPVGAYGGTRQFPSNVKIKKHGNI